LPSIVGIIPREELSVRTSDVIGTIVEVSSGDGEVVGSSSCIWSDNTQTPRDREGSCGSNSSYTDIGSIVVHDRVLELSGSEESWDIVISSGSSDSWSIVTTDPSSVSIIPREDLIVGTRDSCGFIREVSSGYRKVGEGSDIERSVDVKLSSWSHSTDSEWSWYWEVSSISCILIVYEPTSIEIKVFIGRSYREECKEKEEEGEEGEKSQIEKLHKKRSLIVSFLFINVFIFSLYYI
jgi:hypothetical protein